jgi:hypothetical protein
MLVARIIAGVIGALTLIKALPPHLRNTTSPWCWL